MLKGVPQILSPELLKILCEMGHSDQIVIADGNFPTESIGKDCKVVRCDGHEIPKLLEAILKVFPLDTYIERPVKLMEVMTEDTVKTPIWDEYKTIISKYDNRGNEAIGTIDRFKFYDEAKDVYAIIATGEKALYANVILQKGVVVE
ncbi:RbsD/FucU domain-containing protein [Clostridium sp. CCUG 7971]|uniref:RbsD/FucU family protein n=1 Tax=Clostridium sp. CCUG 7971 TaxID=2811414 RepID=UPI001ABA3E6D|nr:RbsD/FucU domain-containing protein [Clostridium sp. CCUG 7971]MBO3445256.1 fucose isomerase [Clostridium sp. CCUG 7971]